MTFDFSRFLFLKDKNITVNLAQIDMINWGENGNAHLISIPGLSQPEIISSIDDKMRLEEKFGKAITILPTEGDDSLV